MKTFRGSSLRLILWLAAFPSCALPVQAITFTTDTTIGPNDTNYDSLEIVVSNCTLTVDGSHSFASLQILNGATLTHAPDSDGLDLAIAGNAVIETGGKINVNARGYSSGAGPGAGSSQGNPATGSGAGHGGFGGLGTSNNIGGSAYGSILEPVEKGSGGGSGVGGHGGNGGGAIKLIVGGALRIDGGISANGATAINSRAGGGAGGSVWLSAQTVSGMGSISANGGAGEPIHGGGGGGGRIAIYSVTNSFAGSITARGGLGFVAGGAGTVYSKTLNQSVGKVAVNNGGQSGANTLLSAGGPIDLTLYDGAKMVVISPQTIAGLHIASNSWFLVTNQALTVTGNVTIDFGGGILADGTGLPSGQGAGFGGTSSAGVYGITGGGGGHGGFGAASAAGAGGGNSHGILLQPTVIGSGGGRGNGTSPGGQGGAGGGAVRLGVFETLVLNGVISANGTDGVAPHSGGGSGGSVWITAGTLIGSGVISAKGGAGNGLGGGGGGGRIAVYYSSNAFVGTLTARGNDGGTMRGGAGTIYTKPNNQPAGFVTVDNGGVSGTNTTFGSFSTFASELTLKGRGALVWPSGSFYTIRNLFMDTGTLLIATNPAQASMTVTSNATINTGAVISADGGGFPAGQGTGAGATANNTGGGGGYGGIGGASAGWARGGSAYGSNLVAPAERGSGGGYAGREFGGAGGGSIRLNVSGTLLLDGAISANGLDAGGLNAGGGSGGSLWLTVGRMTGSGSIVANGGAGNSLGGGGGGGRVALHYLTNQFSGSMSAYGGPGGGGIWGGAGTVYSGRNAQWPPGLVVVDNGGHEGTTPLNTASVDLTITGRASVVSASSMTLYNLFIASNSFLLATNATAFTLTINSNATIQSGAGLSVDGAGFSSGSGTGAGRITTSTQFGTTGSGAGYGGAGGRSIGGAQGGAAYGSSMSQPTDRGSGGGAATSGSGGAGGGALRFNVARMLLLDGTISADGRGATNFNSGGGSGGSVWLTAGTLAGSGSITANGGAGGNYGGGGGGGRIAIGYGTNSFNGSLAAHGGGGNAWGGAGTVYLKASNQPVAQVFVDNRGHTGTNTLFSESGTIDLTLQGGGVLSRSGTAQSFRNLIVGSNSWVLLTNQFVTATNIHVEAGGGIIADGAGFGSGQGPGAGRISQAQIGSGGGHGGYGASSGSASGGNGYDGAASPVTMGSGGGNATSNSRGGAGGGLVRLIVTGTLNVDGKISADGLAGDWNSGGGSGGSISLNVRNFSGSGLISANGGAGNGLGGGGGGGGRIAVRLMGGSMLSYYGSNSFSGVCRTWGGASGTTNPMRFGGAGTIYLTPNDWSPARVLADNGGQTGTNTLLLDSGGFDLAIQGGAAVVPTRPLSLYDLLIASNGWLVLSTQAVSLIGGSATIQNGGGIIADRMGFAGGQGFGAGSNLFSSIYGYTGGGGGLGGLGAPSDGNAPGGKAYGVAQFSFPGSGVFAGSGGGGNPTNSAGAGGGIIRLSTPELVVDGRISADGGDGIYQHGGGGSGGSIALNVGVLSGSGVISADGGDGNGVGGGGGGGRVAITCSTNEFTGAMRAWGGLGGGGAGGAGTVYLKTNSLPVARVLVDNGGWPGVVTPLENLSNASLNVKGGAVVQPSSPYLAVSDLLVDDLGSVTSAPGQSNLDLIIYSNAVIAIGGAVSVDGLGFDQAIGPGAGLSADGFGSGAGHGGFGGASVTAPGGNTYGSFTQPIERGSGGGLGFGPLYGGSEGGGAIRLNVGGTLTVNGRLSANGRNGLQDSSGGGSGGSIWVTTGAFAGDGAVTAHGGAGEWFGGGGGAGGRIAIYYRTSVPTNRFTGELSAFGGEGEYWGEDGTVFLSSGVAPLQVISQLPNGVVSNAVTTIEIAFNLPVNPASLSSADSSITTPSQTVFGTNLSFSLVTPSSGRISVGDLTEPGDYVIHLGPAIEDFYARPMLQVYTGKFTVVLPAIEGTITDANGLPVPGVLLQSTGRSPVVSDANGRYRVGFVPGSSLTVAPAKSGLMFVPRSMSYTNMTATLTNQNYLAVDTIAPPITVSAQGDELALGWYGYSGVRYQLLWSTNLMDWLPYGSGVIGSNTLIQVLIPIEGEPMQFFRVRANN